MISVGQTFPNAIYVGAKDKIIVTVWTSLTLALSDAILFVRFIDEQCQESLLKFFVSTTSDRIRVRNFFAVSGPGYILSCTLFVDANTATPRRGEMYATVGIAQFKDGDDTHVSTFLAGYVVGRKGLSFPPAIQEDSVSGAGLLRSVTGTNPAAGSEINESVPTNARWLLRFARITLVTSDTVATRRMILVIGDGTNSIYAAESQATQAASLTRTYHFASGVGYEQTAFAVNSMTIGIPPITLFQAYTIRSDTPSIQTGDNYNAPLLTVEEWIED